MPETRSVRGGRRGFTIVELLVVVAILAMLASVGIIQLLRVRMVTHEQLALTTLRHFAKTCQQYLAVNSVYPADLLQLTAPVSNPPYLDATLAGNGTTVTKQGYTFIYASPNPDGGGAVSFRVLANPANHGTTGERHFSMNEQGEIFVTTQNRDATPADPTIP